jgi:hypothetical protein
MGWGGSGETEGLPTIDARELNASVSLCRRAMTADSIIRHFIGGKRELNGRSGKAMTLLRWRRRTAVK